MKPEENSSTATSGCLVIPAAGLGTRMRHVHPGLPKELLPLAGKPAVQYAVEEGMDAGIRRIVLIVSRAKEIVRRYFEDEDFSRQLYPGARQDLVRIRERCELTFLYQKEPLGEADAISYAARVAGGRPVAVIYPDNIYLPAPGALRVLQSVFADYETEVLALSAVSEAIGHTIGNAGRVDVAPLGNEVYRIEKLLPKAAGTFAPRSEGELRTCGISIVGPYLFDYIERARSLVREGEFTDFYVRGLLLREKGLLGCRLPGAVYDVGNPAGYALCRAQFEKG